MMGDAGSRSAMVELFREMMEEMLPDTEWPGRAVIVLDVSLETSDKGLGMNSRVSEKPTLARNVVRGVGLGSLSSKVVTSDFSCATASGKACGVGLFNGCSGVGNA